MSIAGCVAAVEFFKRHGGSSRLAISLALAFSWVEESGSSGICLERGGSCATDGAVD